MENPIGLVFGSSSSFRTEDTDELSLWLKERGGDLLDSTPLYSDDVFCQVNTFFEQLGREDPKKLFSCSSKVILSIKKYPEIQQIFLINEFLKKNHSSNLVVFCDDREIYRLLKSVFSGEKFFRLELPSLYAWLRFFRTFLRVCFSRKPKKPAKRLILTLSNTFPSKSSDAYFGALPSVLSNDESTVVVCICAGKQIVFSGKSNILVLESFSRVSDVVVAWLKTIIHLFLYSFRSKKRGENLLFFELSHFIKSTELKKGDFFYHSFMLSTFRRLFLVLKPSTLVYPFENRSWEKLLLRSAYDAQCSVTVGYQHSSITPRHLSLKISKTEFNSKELPNKIITVGRVTFNWLKKNSPLIADRLIIGGSLRKVQAKLTLPDSKGILVAISSSFYEAKRILSVMNEVSKKTTTRIIIRSHPTINIDTLYNSMNWPNHVELSKEKNLSQDISKSHVIVYSSSTVAIEGMLSGRLPIFLDIGDCPSGDPLLGTTIFSASSAKDVQSVLNQIDSASKKDLENIQQAAIKFAESYLQDINPEDFLNLL